MIGAHAGVLLVGDPRDVGSRTQAGCDINVVQPVQRQQFQPAVAHIADRRYDIVRQFALIVEAPLQAVGGALEGIEDIADVPPGNFEDRGGMSMG